MQAGARMGRLAQQADGSTQVFSNDRDIDRVVSEAQKIIEKGETNSHDEAMAMAAERCGYGDTMKR